MHPCFSFRVGLSSGLSSSLLPRRGRNDSAVAGAVAVYREEKESSNADYCNGYLQCRLPGCGSSCTPNFCGTLSIPSIKPYPLQRPAFFFLYDSTCTPRLIAYQLYVDFFRPIDVAILPYLKSTETLLFFLVRNGIKAR